MALSLQLLQRFRNAIASIESAGSGDYSALGSETNGDRAYGRYQVMGANIGPWTRQALGRELTPQQFLSSHEAQDAVFDTVFGGYVERFGPAGAAQAWFAGPGSVGREGSQSTQDALGTSVSDYVNRFNRAVGSGTPASQAPSFGGGRSTAQPIKPPAAQRAPSVQPVQPQPFVPVAPTKDPRSPEWPRLAPQATQPIPTVTPMYRQAPQSPGYGPTPNAALKAGLNQQPPIYLPGFDKNPAYLPKPPPLKRR